MMSTPDVENHPFLERADVVIPGGGESLKAGIWPRSLALWMAAFYVALFIIRPWEKLFPWMADIRFERLYAMAMLTVVLFSVYKHKIEFYFGFQTITVLLFLAALGLSSLLARIPALAWDPFYEYVVIVIFYFVLLSVIRNPYDLVFMVACYIVAMATYLAKAEWEYFVHGAHRYDQGVIRMVGIESTFGGPNSLAMSIVVSLPMLRFLWLAREEFTTGWPDFWRRWFPWGLAIYLSLALTSLALTNSRSGMMTFVFYVVMIALGGSGFLRKFGYILGGAVLIVILWFFLPEDTQNRLRSIWQPDAGPANAAASAHGRVEGFRAGVRMFEQYPLTGVGIGNFIPYRVGYVDGVPLNAHNLAGQVLGETGLIGAATFLLMVLVTAGNCFRVRRLARANPAPALAVLSLLALAMNHAVILLMFEGLFGHNLRRFNWLWLAAFSVLAVQSALRWLKEEEEEEVEFEEEREERGSLDGVERTV